MADQAPGAPSAPQQPGQAAPANDQSQDSGQQGSQQAQAANAEAIIADPNAPKAVKVAAAKRLKSLKIKVDGQDYEERLPFEIDDTKENRDWMTKQLQFSKVSQKRMGEKAQLENEVRSFLEQLKSNPKKLLSDPTYGVDVKKLAAQIIEEEIANSAKSPELLAKEKLEAELQALKDERKRDKEEGEKRELEQIQQREYERYDSLMTQALETSDLPKSPYVVKKIADYLKLGITNGMDVTPADVLPMVREEILEDIRQMAQAMPLETIEKLFGGDVLTKIRKKNVAKAKSSPQTSKPLLPDVGATKASPQTEKTDKKTIKQLWGI